VGYLVQSSLAVLYITVKNAWFQGRTQVW